MDLSRNDVKKVAELAKLEFSEAELDEFTDQLGKIVSFVEQLGEVSTAGVAELAHPLDVHSATRSDVPRTGLTREVALANAPNQDGEFFLVPPVMAKK